MYSNSPIIFSGMRVEAPLDYVPRKMEMLNLDLSPIGNQIFLGPRVLLHYLGRSSNERWIPLETFFGLNKSVGIALR